ncbi:hypothetical protein HWV62_27277 [Athelia sp. TMB]|nr:hypothetical protein HWV62_27277 [Athelia sp. TMB]
MRRDPPPSAEMTLARDIFGKMQLHLEFTKERTGDAQRNPTNSSATSKSFVNARTSQVASRWLHRPAVHRLPNEILSLIFMFCIPSEPYPPSDSVAPVLLYRICRVWRDVARSTGRLWSSICFPYTDAEGVWPGELSVNEWLRLSGEYPLTIHFYFPCQPYRCDEIPHRILQEVISQCHRWKNIEITIAKDALRHFGEVEGRLPLLESLTLHCWDWPGDALSCFQHAPRLKSLQFCSFDRLQDIYDFNLPLHSLTEIILLNLGQVSVEELVDILKTCHYLKHLKWIQSYDDDIEFDFEPSEDPLQHASLQSLSLVVHAMDGETFGVMGFWSLPELREIHLEISDWDSRDPAKYHESWPMIDEFTDLLNGLISPLQVLSINCEDLPCFSGDDLLECLIACPSLVELHLHDLAASALTRRVLGALTLSTDGNEDCARSSGPYIPSLQVMKVDWIVGVFLDKAFARMVESRQVHPEHLHALPSTVSQLRAIDIRVLEREWEDDEDFDPGDDEDMDWDEEPARFDLSMIPKTIKVFRKYEAHGLRASVRAEDESGCSTYFDLR